MQDAAIAYARLGYRVFPILPGLKKPAGALVEHGVNDATGAEATIRCWFAREPKANIGLACEGLIVIDCDPGNDWPGAQRLQAEAQCPMQCTPRGGRHFLFRRPEDKLWINSQSRLAHKIDTRTDGGYIVAAPSHTIDCPDEKTVEGDYVLQSPLPPIDEVPYPPDWLIAELDAKFAPKWARLPPPSAPVPASETDVVARAIAYLAACPAAVSGQSGHNQTFAVTQALLNGFCLEPETALRLLRDHYNPRCEPPWSEKELQHKVDSAEKHPSEKPRGWLKDHSLDELPAWADISGIVGMSADSGKCSTDILQNGQCSTDISHSGWIAVDSDDAEDPVTEEPDPGGFPERLLDVPGFIGEMSRFVAETNHTRQPVLALSGALAFQGFLAGRKVRDPLDTRTNVYVLALAETCCGKERARDVCKGLLNEYSDRGRAMYFERPASYQGVQRKVYRQPQCILLWDEIGQSLRTYRKAEHSPHLQGIMRTITEFFSSANNIYCSDSHSDDKHDYTIVQPNLVVYGTSTPDELFAGLTLDSIKNGFCGRMILFEGDNDPEDADQDEVPPLPKALIEAVGQWLAFSPPGNDLNAVMPNPLVVPRTAAAKAVFHDLLEQQRASRRHEDPIHRALWGRSVEKASQLALIHACSKYGPDKRRLQIDREAAEWACEVVRHATRRILHAASHWIADDDFHDKQNEVIRFVRQQGGGVNQNKITRRFHRWSIRVRGEVLQNLVATGLLITGKGPETGRGNWYFVPGMCPRTVN